jgi:hypothetical protein
MVFNEFTQPMVHPGSQRHLQLGAARARLLVGQRHATARSALRQSGRSHHALIEFVRRDEPEAFLKDARALCHWLQIGN